MQLVCFFRCICVCFRNPKAKLKIFMFKNKKAIALFSISIFFVSIGIFYFLSKSRNQQTKQVITSSVIGTQLPKCRLVDHTGEAVDESLFKNGKIILVFTTVDCDYCLEESKFLNSVIAKNPKIPFYGVVLFSSDREILKYVESKFPFKVFLDEDSLLRKAFDIKGVPIKLYLENGVVKKAWIGSTQESQKDFISWLNFSLK